ncbi:MAG: FecR domain-containing protein, partial [Leptospira sp.]|nr:FecR domain-containing protein [Leptospira sp.]
MKKKLLFTLSIVLVTFSAYHIYSQSKNNATVTFVVGKNSWKESKNAKWQTMKKGDNIKEGSIIRTGNGSRATILVDGSEFKLAPKTEIELTSLPIGKKDGEVNVISGFTWYNIIKQKGKNFSAKTPTITAGVRGTSFSAMYDPKKKESKNCICEGSVSILDEKTKKSLLVNAGGGATYGRDGNLKEESYKEFIKK